jgi:hypothetical protein
MGGWFRWRNSEVRVGRSVARAWNPARGEQEVKGWSCREGKIGTYHGYAGSRVTCSKGSARVQLDSVGE